jgi:hypothetical protein
MTNEQRTHKQAAKASKTEGARYVVYVFDQGYEVWNREQCRMYAPLVIVEALYVDGVKVAGSDIASQLVAA